MHDDRHYNPSHNRNHHRPLNFKTMEEIEREMKQDADFFLVLVQ